MFTERATTSMDSNFLIFSISHLNLLEVINLKKYLDILVFFLLYMLGES